MNATCLPTSTNVAKKTKQQLKNEDGLSVMDIQEELDGDGNVTR